MSPIAAIPNALSTILFGTFGRWSSIFQGFCCVLIVLIERKISWKTGRPHYSVKIVGDITWVCVTVLLEMLFLHRISSVGIGTVLSMFLTGFFIGRITKIRDTLIKKRSR